MLIAILTVILLLLGGALIIFIYDAYRKLNQTYLLLLSLGFFILVVGGALPGIRATIGGSQDLMLAASLILQMVGIVLIFYSVVK